MVVNQIERSLSLFRIKGLRDHGLRLQRTTLEPLNDLREEMSVEPGPHEGEFLLHDLLLTDVAGCRREAEETNAAGRACDPGKPPPEAPARPPHRSPPRALVRIQRTLFGWR